MNKLYLSILAVCFAVTANAQQRTDDELREIAAQQLLTAGVKAQVAGQRDAVQDIRELTTTDNLAIYGSDEAGFVVMARDSRMSPVLGVSLNSYAEGDEPCGFKWWLEAQERALNDGTARMNIGARAPEIIPNGDDEGDYTPVANFVASTWGQNSPFNQLCPKQGTKETPAGCVATAMAQIMRYNRYPARSTGKAGYTVGASQTTIPATLNSTFNYSVMVNNYGYGKRTDESKTAVATLMRDCGFASRMNYTADGSGAYPDQACLGLTNNLGYDTLAIQMIFREFYTEDEWMSIIQEELLAGRAILYSASDANYGGHAFVFSGIDAQGKVYVNWGWDGTADGYFTIDNLAPRGILGSSLTYNFSEDQAMIIGFTPDGKPLEGAEYESHLIMPGVITLSSSIANSLTVNFPGLYNNDYLSFYGETYALIENDEDDDIYDITRLFSTEVVGVLESGYGMRETSFDLLLNDLPAGDYTFYILGHSIDSEYFTIVRSVGGVYVNKFSKDAAGKVTVAEPSLYDSITAVEADDAVQSATQTAAAVLKKGCFDLSGRAVSKPSQGLYIINGKKVLMR